MLFFWSYSPPLGLAHSFLEGTAEMVLRVQNPSMWRSSIVLVSVLFGCLMSNILSLNSAAAETVKLCNYTSYVLEAATAVQDGNASQSKGWVRMFPGKCEAAPQAPSSGAELFVYARSLKVHAGDVQNFTGAERFCIRNDANFEINGRRECRMRGYVAADFSPAEYSSKKNQIFFSESYNFNRKQAQVAGAQRLLSDIGYEIGVIDGFAGRRTRDSLKDFQNKNDLKQSQTITQNLLAKLFEKAEETSKTRGLQLCNDTPHLVWSAIGFVSKDNFTTQGWLKIPSDECIRAINKSLLDRYYFVYAEAVDKQGKLLLQGGKPLIWGGTFNLCTKPTRFTIEGRNECAEKGFDKTGFMKIDTGKEQKWIMRFE
ncbi:MAG: DUF1036 domain-containing protein [Alphaproteobacteria bacterium]|nr:DUF1036 domain-containing protein [Alphaproteobacteria bacterium]